MANPKDDPYAFTQHCVMNPDSPTFQGDPRDALKALDDEIARERARTVKLKQAREVIADRHGL